MLFSVYCVISSSCFDWNTSSGEPIRRGRWRPCNVNSSLNQEIIFLKRGTAHDDQHIHTHVEPHVQNMKAHMLVCVCVSAAACAEQTSPQANHCIRFYNAQDINLINSGYTSANCQGAASKQKQSSAGNGASHHILVYKHAERKKKVPLKRLICLISFLCAAK